MSGQGFRIVLQLGSTMVLARLLTPDDFGLIGMVMIVVSFLNMFKDFGLSQATIQRSEITREEVSNLFWVNIAVTVFLTLCVALCAPLVASFYGRAELASLTVVLASFMILQGAGLQHRALITQKEKLTPQATPTAPHRNPRNIANTCNGVANRVHLRCRSVVPRDR